MKALYFDGANGEKVREEAIPADLADEAADGPRSTCSKRCRCTATS